MSYYIRKLMQNRKAFTMVELVFVIVVIGILSAVAIPKLAATRDDAEISKARATVASVRNAIATERQTRILRGEFQNVTTVGAVGGASIFDVFDATPTDVGGPSTVLTYPLTPCATASSRGCWITIAGPLYRYRVPASATNLDFSVNNNFNCTNGAAACSVLTQ